MRNVITAVFAGALTTVAGVASAQDDGTVKTATATLMGAEGAEHGSVTMEQTPNGVLLTLDLKDVPAGVHGFHIHETGKCEPDFKAAGGHFAEGKEHGMMVEGGPHPGDMPNIHVSDSGALQQEILNTAVSLNEGDDGFLMDEDGSAIMIHSGADDYKSQPSGDAGDRIACGVIEME
ncbi:superoxide dismutase family protein [Notoacmeibacter sp. MSK16QG-6]|uniref:superoxide dismutase family protein n=1 Tax=Notoacmeibacter sp. MSK16QG-6 TaxID=2957982 RepID=UPI00209FE88C|nr:superoxide dismutase family protein [Notoacmeibacter sp. MSK16QG-6]MCP1200214.1 superoxide dismutase family protein [Notoacmeibacter sp. MSK16QG-6]